jgi:SAM-dependent methyltransferase
MRSTCPGCDATSPRPLLTRTNVPVHQNRLASTRDEAAGAARGDIELACCARCGLVFNRAFAPELLRYAPGYENDQTASPLFAAHVEERIQSMLRDGVRRRSVIEIGCGNGEFLRRLCREGANRGVGFDPVSLPAAADDASGVHIEPQAFCGQHLEPPADVAVSRHVIEHLPEPRDLLALVRAALADNDRTRLYLETPCIEWIAETLAIWDLFYEHACYFGELSLANVLSLAGFETRSLQRVFGDQYLWAVAAPGRPKNVRPPSDEELGRLEALAACEAAETRRWRQAIDAWSAEGPVAVWGAGGKGTTFLHLADPSRARVDMAVDVHPLKQGKFIPGTGHPVVAPDDPRMRDVRHVIVMNPNYAEEVERRIRELGVPATVHVAQRE